MDKKIMSIAPSFNCSLKCEGCYLTSDVSREMRDATKDDYYWNRAMEEGVRAGFNELAITLNPFPGAVEHTTKLAKMAKSNGFKTVNVTATHKSFEEFGEKQTELVNAIDILSISVDDQRFNSFTHAEKTISAIDDFLSELDYYEQGKILNINLLWTPTVFAWFKDDQESFEENFSLLTCWREDAGPGGNPGITVQHLIYKPLSLYKSAEWFWENYRFVFENAKEVKIAGNGTDQIGDVALGNLMGMNMCPGRTMVDIDPMGFVRKCPENPEAYDGTNLAKLRTLLKTGVPGCDKAKCNCII